MSKARSLADLGNVYDDGALSHRNLIINGDHRVSQRGTSAVTVTTSASYRAVDRWKTDIDGSAGHDWSHEQSTDGPTGFGYSSKITVVTNGTQPTTAGTNHQFYTLLEKQDVEHLSWGTSDAKTVTFSFYVKSSVTGDHGIRFIHYGSSTNPVYNTHYTINTANTWERKTITITGPTTGGITANANAQAWLVEFKLGNDTAQEGLSGYQAWETTNTNATKAGTVYLPATSGATWFVTGCQLECSDTATPFEHRSFADSLQKCLRYFNNIVEYGGSGVTAFLDASAYSSGQNYGTYTFPVPMRAAPTLSYSSLSDFATRFGNNVNPTTITTHGSASSRQVSVRLDGTSSAGEAGWYEVKNSDAYLYLDAEL